MAKKKTKPTKAISLSIRHPAPMSEPQEIIDLVRDPAVGAEKLQALLNIRSKQRMEAAESAYIVAMSDAQARMEPVRKDCQNNQTRSRYASYAALDRAIRQHYSANGFALSYNTEEIPTPDMMRVTCRVMHKAGYSEPFHIDIPIVTKGPQGRDVMTATHATMSAVTYGKRALLKMAFNIAEAGEDDDGNLAGGAVPISEKAVGIVKAKIEATGTDESAFLNWMGVESVEQITEANLGKAMVGLEQRAKVKKESVS
jgi:hypothetical protein